MRNTDDLVHQTKRGSDLSRSGQKRNDPNHFSFYLVLSARTGEEQEQGEENGGRSSIPTISRTLSVRDALQNTDCLRDQQDDYSQGNQNLYHGQRFCPARQEWGVGWAKG
jgi:hypothetical protein